MATTLTLDPRFQVPDSLATTDPAHPLNLMRSAIEVQNQAAADSVYDMPTPERFREKKEGFRSPFNGPSDTILAVGLLVLAALVWFSARNTVRPLYMFLFVLALGVFFLIHKKAFDP